MCIEQIECGKKREGDGKRERENSDDYHKSNRTEYMDREPSGNETLSRSELDEISTAQERERSE